MSGRVSLENLSFAYGRVPALDDISAVATGGAVTSVIGPNASGKSTLLRCVLGSLHPQRGRVLIDGRPAHQMKARAIASRVAYVPQRSTISASFTVREIVELGRYVLSTDPRRVDDAIDRLDLHNVAGRIFSTLSVGQQQRVMLARALAQLAPEGVLLLDEPTSAMDLRHVRDTMAIVREVADAGATVLLVVHDLTQAATVADAIWMLNEGRLLATGTATEVLQPDRLEGVFGVPFEWMEAASNRRILMPSVGERTSNPLR